MEVGEAISKRTVDERYADVSPRWLGSRSGSGGAVDAHSSRDVGSNSAVAGYRLVPALSPNKQFTPIISPVLILLQTKPPLETPLQFPNDVGLETKHFVLVISPDEPTGSGQVRSMLTWFLQKVRTSPLKRRYHKPSLVCR